MTAVGRVARRLWADQRGAGTLGAFLVLFAVIVPLGVGILVDSARVMSTDRRCRSIALEAARAGANALDVVALRGGVVAVDPAGAQASAAAAAAAYVSGSGATLTSVTVEGDRVTVTVSATVAPLLGVLSTRTVSKSASATATVGIVQEGP